MLMPKLDASGRPRFTRAAAVVLIAAVILLSCGPTLGCGPGRGFNRRRSPRKLNALVFKQHIPNVSENTIGASGLPEGKITRDHPKFRELVPNYNADIIFKDEEGTGADRLMTQRCKEKLNTLAISVMNMWPGVRVRVTEAYDEEGYHARNSLHEEGRAVDLTTSDRDRSKYGMLARLAVEAGFDFVFYESRSHIHCSVKSESADAARSGGCFNRDSTVQTPQGRIKMSDIHIGDSVLVAKSGGGFEFSEVILFLDRDEEESRVFNTIITESGATVTVTPSHLIFVTDDERTLDISEAYATFAKNIEIGDYMFVKHSLLQNRTETSNGKYRLEKVVQIISSSEKGSFAPLTSEGNIVVNNVVASCYALLHDQTLAHFAFLPVRIMTNFKHAALYVLHKLHFVQLRTPKSTTPPQRGIHWYPKLLYKVTHHLLPARYLYR